MNQMWRSIGIDSLPSGTQHGLQISDRATLAIGPCDVQHWRQVCFGIAQDIQQSLHTAQREIDQLGMEVMQAGEDASAPIRR